MSARQKARARRLPVGVIVMEADRNEDLKKQLQDLVAEGEEIVAAADGEGRDLTDEEMEKLTGIRAKIEKFTKQIEAREAIALPPGPGRRTTPEPGAPGNNNPRIPAQPRVDAGKGGFRSFGEFAQQVRVAIISPQAIDNRLKTLNAAPGTVSTESAGADGGFAVPPDFRRDIWKKVVGEDSLFARVEQLITSSNSITIPADETTPWQNSGGVQAFWESEAAAITQSKVALEQKNIRLNKLTALVPVSEELLEDAPGLDGYLRLKAPQKMEAKLNTAIVRGTGAGQPLGILNSPSLIVVPAQSGQAADTVLHRNIENMWSRLYAAVRGNAVWLINQDVEPQLGLMSFRDADTNPVPIYLPSGGLSASPFATMKGRPVVPVEACSTVGDLGDILLVALNQYMGVSKGTDIRADVSMHLFFDAAALAYRFIFRVAGMPMWGSAITPQHGNLTRSWAVGLAART